MPAPALAPFQQDAVDALIGGLDRDEGAAVLLEAPTGSGKTLMLGRAAAEIARRRSVVWFWFAPFAAVIDQTTYALAQTCGGLRLRDLVGDRHADLAAEGDVYVTTWAAVAARDSEARRLRRDSDEGPALDRFIDEVRSRGLRLGAVIDEAHHSFRARAQAFAFCRDVLRPDLLMLATATPRDADVEIFRQETGIERLARVTVPRREAVAARLVKRGLRLVVFNASAQDRAVVDFAELALRAAWERHQAIRAALAKRGATMTPLLLVQADSADWTPGRVRAYFTEELHLPESEIAVHTASEPDSDLAAAVKDGGVGVLVFKMAVATGFDAPRAFTLCALRSAQARDFGLQVIGRIMRVHPALRQATDLPDLLDSGHVFLAYPAQQAGLADAAENLKALVARAADFASAPRVAAVERERLHRVGVGGAIDGFALEAESGLDALLARIADMEEHPPPGGYLYRLRPELDVPGRLLTEELPEDDAMLLRRVLREVEFTAFHRELHARDHALVRRKETDLFTGKTDSGQERGRISERRAAEAAQLAFAFNRNFDPRAVARGLRDRLRQTLDEHGIGPLDDRSVQRTLNLILAREPRLLDRAMDVALSETLRVVQAGELPREIRSSERLTPSRFNAYGCMPADLNSWERAFAEALDDDPAGRVLWWLKNADRRTAANAWAVAVVMQDGRNYHPDFVIGIRGRRTPGHVGLVEVKERFDDELARLKIRQRHRDYGAVLMVCYDETGERFLRLRYIDDLDRNVPDGVFTVERLAD